MNGQVFPNWLKFTISILIFSFQSNYLAAQTVLVGFVYDQNSQEGIPYANVGISDFGTGTVSDRSGYFEIGDPRIKKDTKITISCIGYATKVLTAAEMFRKDVIFLQAKTYDIDMVEISARSLSSTKVKYGEGNGIKRGKSIGFASDQLGTEVGALINIKKPSFIKSAHFEVNHAKGDSMHFRVILRPYKSGLPDESILPSELIIHEAQSTGTIDVDLSEYNLNLHGKYLLSLQWIQNDGKKQNDGLTFDTKGTGKDSGIYAKLYSTAILEKLPYHKRLKPCFYLKGVLIN